MKRAYPTFETEAALCQAFLRSIPEAWAAYPETAGFDILLIHAEGFQIGIEAKLTLNAKVIVQAIKNERHGRGPDFRAVLVGRVVAENEIIARHLGLTVIKPDAIGAPPQWSNRYVKCGPKIPAFSPSLPEAEKLVKIGTSWSGYDSGDSGRWFDRFPADRCNLPDYIPEVACGVPSPMMLSDWKIKAMRVCVWVERHEIATRDTFKKLGIDPSRWMTGHWLKPGAQRGQWVAGPGFPANQMRHQHPNVYAKIEADYPEWSQKVLGEAA